MKKLIFIFIVLLSSIDIYCQKEVVDTLFESVGAVDTTVFRVFKRDMVYFTLDVGTMADNDTISIGYSTGKQDLLIPSAITSFFPMKLTKATYLTHIHGDLGVITKYRIGIEGEQWRAKYLAVRIKCAGACSPSLRWNP